jgi:hypothetical protein
MEKARLMSNNLDVAAHRLSENLIFVRYLEKEQIERHEKAGKYPGRIIMTNNNFGEKHDPNSPKWNFEFEGKKHYVLTSFLVDEFQEAMKSFSKIKL